MHRRVRDAAVILVVFALVGPAPARAAPSGGCVLTQEVRSAVREHNTRAKQEFEEDRFLRAALEWLAAQDLVPPDEACAGQRGTRIDLAVRSLRSYLGGLRYASDDAAHLDEAHRLLERHVESLLESERKTVLVELAAELECVRAALPDNSAALACTAVGRAVLPPPAAKAPPPPPPIVFLSTAPAQERRLERRRRGLAIGFGVGLGLGVGALAAAVGTWAVARTGGPLHREIRDAAADSVVDDDPADDVPPNLPPDQDYCVVARNVGNLAVVDLCERHQNTAAASIAGFALTGAFAVMSVTFGALWWAASRRPASRSARSWRLDVASMRAGATLTGTVNF